MATNGKMLALVTGAAQGIGRATTARLLQDGCRVIALDRNEDSLDELQAELGGDVLPVPFDLSDGEAIAALVAELTEQHGPISRLVNNAGVWPGGRITELTDDVWQLAFAVNTTAPFALIRAIAPVMAAAGGGAIVNVVSRNAFRSSTGCSAYDASKAALLALTRTAGGELAADGIRVNAVCPGVISTPGDLSIEDPLFKAAYTRQIPMNRYGDADEIASVIAFLLGRDSSFMTGQAVIVDGGQIACQDNRRYMEIPGLSGE